MGHTTFLFGEISESSRCLVQSFFSCRKIGAKRQEETYSLLKPLIETSTLLTSTLLFPFTFQ